MKPADREILRLSLPAIASNVTVPLLGLCDTAVTGHLGSPRYLAAIAVGTTMLNVLFWLFGFLRMGTTGIAARACGAADSEAVKTAFTRSVSLAVAIGCVLSAMSPVLLGILTPLTGVEADISGDVARYFSICIFEAPALLGTMAVTGWFVGMQSTVWPMVIAVTVNLLNIVLSVSLVFFAGLGFEGTAWGTLAANWAGFFLSLAVASRFAGNNKIWCNPFKAWETGGVREYFSLNANLFFRSFCITGVTLGMTAAGARLGTGILAVNAVAMQFFMFFSFFADGFAFAAEALVGKAAGAGARDAVRMYARCILRWGMWTGVVFTLLYYFGLHPAVALLTDLQPVADGVMKLRWAVCLIPVVSVWAFIYDGFFIGLASTRRMFVAVAMASAVFFAAVWLCLNPGILLFAPEAMLWTAFLLYLFIRGAVLALSFPAAVGSVQKKSS